MISEMKMIRARSGPFAERPYYEDSEFESIATDALRKVGLFPTTPEPIRVDRFIEKRFNIVPEYDDVPDGILGFTRFGTKGPEAVVVSRLLADEGSRVAERRINSTLAHEAGHILLHGRLFSFQRRAGTRSLFENDLDEERKTILCRHSIVGFPPESVNTHGYDGRWWEFQANKVIGVLLLPRQLVNEALDSLLVPQGILEIKRLDDTRREEAVRRLADTFDVNPAVARIRIGELFPAEANRQLTL